MNKADLISEAYNILGLKKSASLSEVGTQYRKLARDTHPDKHPDIDLSKFREINEAYTNIVEYLKSKEICPFCNQTPSECVICMKCGQKMHIEHLREFNVDELLRCPICSNDTITRCYMDPCISLDINAQIKTKMRKAKGLKNKKSNKLRRRKRKKTKKHKL
jgi:hypothetical protein